MSGDRQQLVDDYLDALLRRDDISPYFTPDVLWRTMETEADFVGRHTAEFAGIPPSGADVDVAYCVTYGLSDAGITWLRVYLPVAQLVGQLQAGTRAATA